MALSVQRAAESMTGVTLPPEPLDENGDPDPDAPPQPPAPEVQLVNYGNSAIEYSVRCWASVADYWRVYFAVRENLRDAFARHGVEMTYDHLNVHVIEK